MRLKKVVRTALSLSLLVAIAGLAGCSGSGSGQFKGKGKIFGQEFDFDGSVKWGPNQPLPPGSVYKGYVIIRGRAIDIFCDPNGCEYIQLPGSSGVHKLIGGAPIQATNKHDSAPIQYDFKQVEPPVTIGSNRRPRQGGYGWNINDVDLGEGSFAWDVDTDFLSVTFSLPAAAVEAGNYLDPSESGYAFELDDYWFQDLENGDREVHYEGSINEVLGAAAIQGVTEMTSSLEVEPGVFADVKVEFDTYWMMWFGEVDGAVGPGAFNCGAIVDGPEPLALP